MDKCLADEIESVKYDEAIDDERERKMSGIGLSAISHWYLQCLIKCGLNSA